MDPIVVMGVAASGKSVVGRAIAARIGVDFVDGDDLHPAANVAKMAAGTPLTDTDRGPWLDAVGGVLQRSTDGVVVACSALRASYRTHLRTAAGHPIRFVHLDVSEAELRRRIAARTEHFMPPSLLTDQLATLEWPGAEADVTIVDGDRPLTDVIDAALSAMA